jgi:hypothetical protein
MAQIVIPTQYQFKIVSDHYRLIGLEFTRPSTGSMYYPPVQINATSKVIVDRCWIHGNSTTELSHAWRSLTDNTSL